MSKTEKQYEHLEARPGSNYHALWLKGRRIRAAVVWEAVHGPDPRTPEEFAQDFQIPLETVLEALDYVEHHQEIVKQDRKREAASLRAEGLLNGPEEG